MKAVCHTDSTNLSQSLIKRICYPELFMFNSKQTEWGQKHENLARQEYVKAVKKDHQSKLAGFNSGLLIGHTLERHLMVLCNVTAVLSTYSKSSVLIANVMIVLKMQ